MVRPDDDDTPTTPAYISPAYPPLFRVDRPDLTAGWLAWPVWAFGFTAAEAWHVASCGTAFLEASEWPHGPDREGLIENLPDASSEEGRAASASAARKIEAMTDHEYGRLVSWLQGFAHGCAAPRP